MSHSNSSLLYHIVFSTKHREHWLTEDVRPGIFAYMAGIINNLDGHAILINGVSDHVHILCRLRPAVAVANTVKETKSRSSAWFHEKYRRSAFAWQEGDGAFSVSNSQQGKVLRYIETQEEHHKLQPFDHEYIALLEKHEVEYDPRFVFD